MILRDYMHENDLLRVRAANKKNGNWFSIQARKAYEVSPGMCYVEMSCGLIPVVDYLIGVGFFEGIEHCDSVYED